MHLQPVIKCYCVLLILYNFNYFIIFFNLGSCLMKASIVMNDKYNATANDEDDVTLKQYSQRKPAVNIRESENQKQLVSSGTLSITLYTENYY